jgi:hypothetical protein
MKFSSGFAVNKWRVTTGARHPNHLELRKRDFSSQTNEYPANSYSPVLLSYRVISNIQCDHPFLNPRFQVAREGTDQNSQKDA